MSHRAPKKRAVWKPIPPRTVNEDFFLQELDGAVETLSTDVTTSPSSTFRLRNLKPVPSYSWIEGTPPAIAVPGVFHCQNINDFACLENARLFTNLEEHNSFKSSTRL